MEEDLKAALKTLREGGLILYPTDTIWGIGCDATNEEAVKKIYALKNRPESKSMIVLVDTEASLERIVPDVPEMAWQLIDVAVNPLTIVYPEVKDVAPSLKASDGSLAIRITGERFSKELCRRFRKPIVSTSANISAKKAPAVFAEIEDDIKNGVDYVVGYRSDENKPASSSNIIKINSDHSFKIIR
ncbi:MAG: threonylcarbamoyl-AMP synthase [Muribaculaceae bacterium]|nr:threonylcarbamoyl-AMP synthase [Muribaculaceae bacterium]